MDVAHIGLVHRDPCECKVKDFHTVSSIERNVSKRRHLQGVQQHRWVEQGGKYLRIDCLACRTSCNLGVRLCPVQLSTQINFVRP